MFANEDMPIVANVDGRFLPIDLRKTRSQNQFVAVKIEENLLRPLWHNKWSTDPKTRAQGSLHCRVQYCLPGSKNSPVDVIGYVGSRTFLSETKTIPIGSLNPVIMHVGGF